MGLVLQSRTSKHGIGRIYTETAVGHGRIALLQSPLKKGRITFELGSAADVLAADSSKVRWPTFKAIGLLGPHASDHECDYEVRMLAPSSGMSEDPITGSLNGAIAMWLQQSGRLKNPYLVAQGTSIGRSGRVFVKPFNQGHPWIGGHVHIIIEGHIQI